MKRRQRKQLIMSKSNPYSSLRSLLPLDYIRGKESICDQLEEAERYIKDLEKNVKELERKRDMLKKPPSESDQYGEIGCSSSSGITNQPSCDNYVKINASSNGVEIEITARVGEDYVFPLSRVLKILLEEGLNVLNCVSSKLHERCIYVINCQVNDEKFLDSSRLQRRLTSEFFSYEPYAPK